MARRRSDTILASEYRQFSTEAEVQDSIIGLADRLGYEWHHETDSRKSRPGFPDLHIVGYGRHWVFELKTATGRVEAEQSTWINAYKAAGVDARIVRPDDLDELLAELNDAASR